MEGMGKTELFAFTSEWFVGLTVVQLTLCELVKHQAASTGRS